MRLLKKLRSRVGGGNYKHLDDEGNNGKLMSPDRPLLSGGFKDSSAELEEKVVHVMDLKTIAKRRGNPCQKRIQTCERNTSMDASTLSTMETSFATSFSSASGRNSPAENNNNNRSRHLANDSLDSSNDYSFPSNSEAFVIDECLSMPSIDWKMHNQSQSQSQSQPNLISPRQDTQDSQDPPPPPYCPQIKPFTCHKKPKHNHDDDLQYHNEPFIETHEPFPPCPHILHSPTDSTIHHTIAIPTQASMDEPLHHTIPQDHEQHYPPQPTQSSLISCTNDASSSNNASSNNARVAELKLKLRKLEQNYRHWTSTPNLSSHPTPSSSPPLHQHSHEHNDTHEIQTNALQHHHHPQQQQQQQQQDTASHSSLSSASTSHQSYSDDNNAPIIESYDNSSCDISDITANTPPPLDRQEILSLLQSEIGQDAAVLNLLERLKEVFAVSIDAIENAERLNPTVVGMMDEYEFEPGVRGEI